MDDIADTDIDDAEEALVLLFELFLVKDLDDEDGIFGRQKQKGFVPVGVQGLFRGFGSLCLQAVDGDDGEGIRLAKDIALVEGLCGDDLYFDGGWRHWARESVGGRKKADRQVRAAKRTTAAVEG